MPNDHGGLGIAQKVRHFLILVPKTAKIGEHINGTSGAESGFNTDWTLYLLLMSLRSKDLQRIY